MLRRVAAQGALLGFIVLASTFSPAVAVEPSGSAVRVDPAVNASGTGGQRLLELEGAVFMGDTIVASANGLAQIKFIDDTRIVIGPNSRLKIDTFVFNPNNTAKKVAINAIRGSFRFISGRSPHEAYSIRTPTMTIGVRGTIVDFTAGPTESSVMFQEGSGSACSSQGCVQIDRRCDIWVAPSGGSMSQATGTQGQLLLAYSYPFNNDQSALAPEFRILWPSCQTADSRFFGPRPDYETNRPFSSPSTLPEPPQYDDDDDCEGDCDEGGDEGGGEESF
jgi:hypothetical protein